MTSGQPPPLRVTYAIFLHLVLLRGATALLPAAVFPAGIDIVDISAPRVDGVESGLEERQRGKQTGIRDRVFSSGLALWSNGSYAGKPTISDQPLEEDTTEQTDYNKVWNTIKNVKRNKRPGSRTNKHKYGPRSFFASAVIFEWLTFGLALAAFFPIHYHLRGWPNTPSHHFYALLVWICVAVVYNCAIIARLGTDVGVSWFTGYLLELIFSVENVFIFHIVAATFRTPQFVTERALLVVICCQLVFEMVFFMGLASQIRSIKVLPYLLGMWLVYLGYHAACDEEHAHVDVEETPSYRLMYWIFGNRLMSTYEECGSAFVRRRDNALCVTLVLPFIVTMLAVDFFLEVDVVLTKIEEIPNPYIAFTSSAVAAFAVPELFFVAQDFFVRYRLLKYGVCFVLIFFGMQMLCHRLIVLPELVGCMIIITVLMGCITFSSVTDVGLKDVARKMKEKEITSCSRKPPSASV